MKIILLSKHHRAPRSLSLNLGLTFAFVVVLLVAPAIGGYYLGVRNNWLDASMLPFDFMVRWDTRVDQQGKRLEEALRVSEQQFDALTLRMAELQARVVRLDALGERLVSASGLDESEFNFTESPGLGGPNTPTEIGDSLEKPGFMDELVGLADEIAAREEQLEILEALLHGQRLDKEAFIAGRPVRQGWMSSRFGRRTDPFNGRIAMHYGVDFAGKEGSDVIAVAAGVVTYAGSRTGYGNLVEISHGNGYFTRYGHLKSFNVTVGDIVKAGEVLAAMGSTGRSTGPHVHFEVLKGGKHLDPSRFIARKRG